MDSRWEYNARSNEQSADGGDDKLILSIAIAQNKKLKKIKVQA